MSVTSGLNTARTVTGRPRARLPAAAERLRLPLHNRSQARVAARWGFDLNAPDASDRAEALLAASPADPDRLLLVAAVRSSRGDNAGALLAALRAVTEDEHSARAQTTLATLLAASGDVDGARRHAALATDLDPGDPVALYNRGLAAWASGERRAARADFDRTTELLGMSTLPWWRRWGRTG